MPSSFGSGSARAASVSFNVVGRTASNNVQAAIEELQSDIDFAGVTNPTSGSQRFTFFDDFVTGSIGGTDAFGSLGLRSTNSSGSAGLKSLAAGEVANIGVVQINSGIAANNYGNIHANISAFFLGECEQTFAVSGYVQRLGDATDTYRYFAGVVDSATTVPANGVYFTADRNVSTTNWVAATSAGGATTSTDTGVAMSTSAANYQNLRIQIDGDATTATFYINGTLVATHTTNLPTGSSQYLGPALISRKTASGNSQSSNFFVDWLYWSYRVPAGRGTF